MDHKLAHTGNSDCSCAECLLAQVGKHSFFVPQESIPRRLMEYAPDENTGPIIRKGPEPPDMFRPKY